MSSFACPTLEEAAAMLELPIGDLELLLGEDFTRRLEPAEVLALVAQARLFYARLDPPLDRAPANPDAVAAALYHYAERYAADSVTELTIELTRLLASGATEEEAPAEPEELVSKIREQISAEEFEWRPR